MQNKLPLPSFFVVGAGKSGTTSIHQYLRQNPMVSLPLRKETHFFIMDKDSALPAPQNYFGKEMENPIFHLKDYLAEFQNQGHGHIVGEVCPSYLFYPNAASNINARVPNAKIIAILRNPIDRFYSNFQFRSNKDQQAKDNRQDFTTQELDRITAALPYPSSPEVKRLLEIGMYSGQLQRYYDQFPSDNIKVFLFDDLQKTPRKLMNELSEFAGIPPFEYDVSMVFNRSGSIRAFWFYKTFRGSKFSKMVQKATPPLLYQRIRVAAERLVFAQANRMSTQSRNQLREYYRDEIDRLQTMLGRDLGDWLV